MIFVDWESYSSLFRCLKNFNWIVELSCVENNVQSIWMKNKWKIFELNWVWSHSIIDSSHNIHIKCWSLQFIHSQIINVYWSKNEANKMIISIKKGYNQFESAIFFWVDHHFSIHCDSASNTMRKKRHQHLPQEEDETEKFKETWPYSDRWWWSSINCPGTSSLSDTGSKRKKNRNNCFFNITSLMNLNEIFFPSKQTKQ